MEIDTLKFVDTRELRIAYKEYGPPEGWPVVLTHGFPYDIYAFEEVASLLAKAGARVFLPYVRGFGPTRFLSDETIRSGQQTARASDLIQFIDALKLDKPIIGGFDWGGNASCAAAALWPDKIGGLVSYAGYDIINVEEQKHSFPASLERICWYQHLFQSERGKECLEENRRELCRMLWEEWSPGWSFDKQTYERTAVSFDNPDFVAVVIHSYRFMHGNALGEKELELLENHLAQMPEIKVPTITLDGTLDPLKPGGTAEHAKMFSGRHEHRSFPSGHNLPQENPQAFYDAVTDLHQWLAGQS